MRQDPLDDRYCPRVAPSVIQLDAPAPFSPTPYTLAATRGYRPGFGAYVEQPKRPGRCADDILLLVTLALNRRILACVGVFMNFNWARSLRGSRLWRAARAGVRLMRTCHPRAARHRWRTGRFYAAYVRRGDLCFDVGANKGDKTAVFLGLGARVVAVEPQAACAARLRERFGHRRDVTLVAKALARGTGRGGDEPQRGGYHLLAFPCLDREREGERALCRPPVGPRRWRCR